MFTNLPRISIVTPSFNSKEYLERAIESVVNQNYPNLEHIIIDGGSNDGTLHLLNKYKQKITWISEPDNGQGDALNKGFQMSTGEIIGWLNADDTYQPKTIWEAIKYFQSNPNVDLLYSHFNFIDGKEQIYYTNCVPRFSLEKLLYGNIVPNAGMFFRKQVIEKVGGINPNLHYVLDWEFVLRIALKCKLLQIDKVWGNFRIVPGTKSVENAYKFWPEIIPVLQRVIKDNPKQLGSYQNDAFFQAYMLGAVEFARANLMQLTAEYLDEASSYKNISKMEVNRFIVSIIETANYPWHQGFKRYSEGNLTILRVINCLGDSPTECLLKSNLSSYLELYQAKQMLWPNTKLIPLEKKRSLNSLYSWSYFKLAIYCFTRDYISLTLRSIKSRILIRLRYLVRSVKLS